MSRLLSLFVLSVSFQGGGEVRGEKPKAVYPYHHRGSDLDVFKNQLQDSGVEVRILKWY